MTKLKYFFIAVFYFISTCAAQIPQWQWAKGIGGNHQESINTNNPLQLDSLGNSYEIIISQSSFMVMGGVTYNNPFGTNNSVAYFVKYNAAGNVVWVKSFGRYPAAIGGGPIIPQSFCTDSKGQSYLQFYFVDSITLGGVTLRDSVAGNNNGNYCIAKYDTDGNVKYIKAHKGKNSGLLNIRQFLPNKMFAVGLVNQAVGDTINGSLIPQGIFMALMDTLGYLTNIKPIGYDSSSGNFMMESRLFAVSNQSVYLQTYFFHPLIYQSTIPIDDIRQYADTSIQGTGKNLFIKFDSLLNFQWFKTANAYAGTHMGADSRDNLYIGAFCPSVPQVDTIKIDSLDFPMPFIPPFGLNFYISTFKFNGAGILQWQNDMVMGGASGRGVTSICFDKEDDVYFYGGYSSYLIAGTNSLNDPGNLFVNKISSAGTSTWLKSTRNAGRCSAGGIKEDGHGNIYLNGLYSDPNYPVVFGTDTLTCKTPVAGYPLAADIFNAKLSDSLALVPLHLLSFNGGYKNNAVLLNWQTVNEINTAYFTIERSTNQSHFANIGKVTAAGNSAMQQDYSFTDNEPVGAFNYYRLKMVDKDGNFTYSKIVTVKINYRQSFVMFPNPANRMVKLHFNEMKMAATVRLYNSVGIEIMNSSLTTPSDFFAINTQYLPAGIYLVQVKTQAGMYQKQLLISH